MKSRDNDDGLDKEQPEMVNVAVPTLEDTVLPDGLLVAEVQRCAE